MAEDEEWARYFQQGKIAQLADEQTNVQLTDELIPHKKGQPFLYESELVESAEDQTQQRISDEVEAIQAQ